MPPIGLTVEKADIGCLARGVRAKRVIIIIQSAYFGNRNSWVMMLYSSARILANWTIIKEPEREIEGSSVAHDIEERV